MENEQELRKQLLGLLTGKNAHMTFEQAVADFPPDAMNQRPPNVEYTPWQLLEHIRIAQWDILDFIRNPDYVSPDWPSGYWPDRLHQASQEDWQQTVSQLQSDLEALKEIVRNPETDLLADLPHAPGYTVLREILVVSDHNAYHLGEFAALRQVMDTWPEK